MRTYEEYCAACAAEKIQPLFEREVYEKVADLIPDDVRQTVYMNPILKRLHPEKALRPLDTSPDAKHAALLSVLPKGEVSKQ